MKVIPEMPVKTSASVSAASWGLDRIGVSQSTTGGQGVHVYVLDTGVRTTHSDFGGRAIPTLEVTSSWPQECEGSTSCARDVHGHGTHCAGTVGGTTYGVAPKSTIHGVKVLSDDGFGEGSWTIGAIDWVMSSGERPAVISMSLGAPGVSQADKVAIDRATSSGITVVVAAGNENANACSFSPAFVPSAITVGSTTSGDSRSWFSNYGRCVDIYAPGSDIISAGHQSNQQSATMSGTSMACPHVSGAAALLLESNPDWKSSQVLSSMLTSAVSGAISDLTSSDPDKLLFVGEGSAPTPAPAGECVDTDNGAKDDYGDGCKDYAHALTWCGQFDSSSFKANEMCCVCGGGQTSSSFIMASQSTKFIDSKKLTQVLNLGVGLISSVVTAFTEDPIDYEYAADSFQIQGWKLVKLFIPEEDHSSEGMKRAKQAWDQAFGSAAELAEKIEHSVKSGDVSTIIDAVSSTVDLALRTCAKAMPKDALYFDSTADLIDELTSSWVKFSIKMGWMSSGASLAQVDSAFIAPEKLNRLLTTGVGIATSLISAFTETPPDFEYAFDSLQLQGWKMVKVIVPEEDHRSDGMKRAKKAWDTAFGDAADIAEEIYKAVNGGDVDAIIQSVLKTVDSGLRTAAEVWVDDGVIFDGVAGLVKENSGSVLRFSKAFGWM